MTNYDQSLEKPEPLDKPTRPQNLTFASTVNDGDFRPSANSKLSPELESQFGTPQIYDSRGNDAEPPPDGPNDAKRDADGRISSQQNPWGKQDVVYSLDEPDKVKKLTMSRPGGEEVYTRQSNGTYMDKENNRYSDVAIDQQSGDITLSRADGTKNIQRANGNSQEFDSNGNNTYFLDYKNRQSITNTYNPATGEQTNSTVTDLRTGRSEPLPITRSTPPGA
jgi:hypothetical protein